MLVRYTLTYTPTLKTVFETFGIVNTIKENSQFYFLTSQRVKTTLCGQATTRKENSYMYDQTQKQFLKISDRLQNYTKNLKFTTSSKKTTKIDFSTSKRLKGNICAREEHSHINEHTQKQFFKISRSLNKTNENSQKYFSTS